MNAIKIPITSIIDQIAYNRDIIVHGFHQGNQQKVKEGVEALSLLIGKCLTRVSLAKDDGIVSQSLSALIEAQDILNHVEPSQIYVIDTAQPSKWLSFDGDLKYPFFQRKSNIPNAGHGLFCERTIKRGEVIGPIRIKMDDKGVFYDDWIECPISSAINHHPIPNLSIVRSDPPMGFSDKAQQACYIVANRNIEIGEELVADYQDQGWAEWDYFDHIPLPFDEWNKNAFQQIHPNSSLSHHILTHRNDYTKSAGLIGGPALLYASTKSTGLYSDIMALGGLLLTGITTWKKS